MGLRGPLKNPASIQRLAGNPGNRALTVPTPLDQGIPSLPSSLGSVGKALWQELTGTLRRRKTLAKEDGRILEATCLAYQDLMAASQTIAEKGSCYESATMNGSIIRPRPECQLRSDAFKRYVRCLEALALTPASRTRLQINAVPDTPTGPLETMAELNSYLDGKFDYNAETGARSNYKKER